MWLKINNRLYNSDYLAEIWQERIVTDKDFPPEPVIFAITNTGHKIKLSDEPVLQEIIGALEPKEVD